VLVGSLATVNGTTNSASIVVGTISVPSGTLIAETGGLPTTSAATFNLQFSIDNANFATFATYNPTATNAGSYTFAPSYAPSNLYFRVQIVTTNSEQVGAIYQN
jgi:hypothetical protein